MFSHLNFDQWMQVVHSGMWLLGIGAFLYAARWILPYVFHPVHDTPKARELVLNKATKMADITIRTFNDRIAKIASSGLSPEAQVAALQILLAETMGAAPNPQAYLAASDENGLLRAGARAIVGADMLFAQLKQTPAWAELQPLLQQLVQTTLGQRAGVSALPATTATPQAKPAPAPAGPKPPGSDLRSLK